MRSKIFSSIDNYLPRFIAKLPYTLTLFVIKIYLQMSSKTIEVWCRHSVQIGTFVFGVSDLDLTILSEKYNEHKFQVILKKLHRLKKIFIFLGETNFYFRSTIDLYLDVANPLEIARDPILKQKYSFQSPDESHHLIFILRNFLADKDNLFERSYLRQKKWISHFNAGPIKYDKNHAFDAPAIIKILITFLEQTEPEYKEEWEKALEYILNVKEFNEVVYWGERPAFVSILLPQYTIWGQASNAVNLNSLTAFQTKVLERQLEWEIWGLYGQLPLQIQNSDQVIEHLNRLKDVAVQIQNNFLEIKFNQLINLWLKSSIHKL